MRIRMTLIAAAIVAALLLPATAAARDQSFKVVAATIPASRAPLAGSHHPQRLTALAGRGEEHDGREEAASSPRIPERAAVGDGTCTVTGTVLGYGGGPVANADVQWAFYDDSGSRHLGVWTQTDATGHFGFSGVAITNRGRLSAWLDNGDTLFRRDWLDFAPGANDYVLRPGALNIQAARSNDPDWNDWETMDVALYGSGTGYCEIAGTSGQAYAMAPDITYSLVWFWYNEAVEWQTASPIPIVTGTLSPRTVVVSEAEAQQVYVAKPYWASGKPGATIGYDLNNWPAGYKAILSGYSEDPDRDIFVRFPGEWTSTGADSQVSLKVPSAATPGYWFSVEATRDDSLWSFTDLHIYDPYQVCTLEAGKTSIHHGTSIIASGVIPTQGHWGTKAGISKTVTLYAHAGSATVPTKWDPKSQGWRKVSSFKADGLGRYKSKPFEPNQTLTLVVRYPGDDWYWRAYTSTQKITVK